MKFFTPSAELKELKLLEYIEDKPRSSQHEIARAIGSAASMVNIYMDRLEEKGYLIRDYKSLKVVHYNITDQGIKRKKLLSRQYFHELLSLYRLTEKDVGSFLRKLESKGYRNVLFYEAGQLTKLILNVLEKRDNNNLNILAIIDDNQSIQGQDFHGYKIISRGDIGSYQEDGIIITSYEHEEEIRKKLREINYPEDRIE